jgi:hypothetical protein
MLKFDGDTVRGLGFVTLYSSYAEEEVDGLLERLARLEPFDDAKRRWPISRKLRHAAELVARLRSDELRDLEKALAAGPDLFERRNEVVHGRIYGGFDRGDTLRSGRPGVPDRPIEADELYDLANAFANYKGWIYAPTIFRLPRALARYLEAAAPPDPH